MDLDAGVGVRAGGASVGDGGAVGKSGDDGPARLLLLVTPPPLLLMLLLPKWKATTGKNSALRKYAFKK